MKNRMTRSELVEGMLKFSERERRNIHVPVAVKLVIDVTTNVNNSCGHAGRILTLQ